MTRKRTTQSSGANVISIKGARVHNLKNISLDIPRDKLVVVTGLSGSGKSSLVFDTIFAEAERRFVESLSSYARQFLGVKEKPDVEEISGLSPAIAIDQKSVAKNPRSTIGTITEIYDYLRILFARIGEPSCPDCSRPVKKQTIDEMVRMLTRLPQGTKLMIASPLVCDRKGEHRKILSEIARKGFLRVRVDGEVLRIEEALDRALNPKIKHRIEAVIDRLSIDKETERGRIADSLETALRLGEGVSIAVVERPGETVPDEMLFSELFSCPACHRSFPPLEPRLFSFNTPQGACADCTGLGHLLRVDPERVFPNKRLTLNEGAIRPWARASHRIGRQSWYWWMLADMSKKYEFSLDRPVEELPEQVITTLLYGDAERTFEGVIPNLERRWKETDSDWTRTEVEQFMKVETCTACAGTRLRPEARAVKIGGKNIAEVAALSAEEAIILFKDFAAGALSRNGRVIAAPLCKELVARAQFLVDVGLEYLTLNRSSTTLSGGEAQRVRLATQIGSGLKGVLYVLDEPSIGLHMRDHLRLIATLKRLRDIGNTVIVVEHDEATMEESDWIVDMGPGAGRQGGKIVFAGIYAALKRSRTLTGDYLSGRRRILVPQSPRQKKPLMLTVRGAAQHNLKYINVDIPLGKLVCVSGVSGSGKSTLVNDILARALAKHFYGASQDPGAHERIDGMEHIDKAVVVDQSPIGRTPRSNPATYTGLFTHIRDLFSKTREARSRGYTAGRFSFNVKGGRCEACEGHGVKKIEMYFLPDIYVDCEECGGKRYNKEALEIVYKDFTIAQVLDLSCEEAARFFHDIPQVVRCLRPLIDVGLGYMKLGQPATTLSGGEAQRVKLATELAKKATGNTFYILDEPTTGLHFDDIQKLLSVLAALVHKGNSVLVIEHNMDVLANADWIIDLGPEGGEKGGKVIATGTPEDIARTKHSSTGTWLKNKLRK
ncbi:MAG: excinuclease ABC subunit UvrA [Parcubacteria group bacterium]|nr:excinuclease ABC subunit UvrA [Parcubacteria group bacterium]